MKIHHECSIELRALEDRLISQHNDPRNITHLEQSLHEITAKIDSIKPKNMYAEGEKRLLTEDINKQYRGDYNINWNDYLNHWMVDYDIIHVLKWHVRYTSWAAVPMKTKQLCYKHYHDNFTLPDWDTNQEKY